MPNRIWSLEQRREHSRRMTELHTLKNAGKKHAPARAVTVPLDYQLSLRVAAAQDRFGIPRVEVARRALKCWLTWCEQEDPRSQWDSENP